MKISSLIIALMLAIAGFGAACRNPGSDASANSTTAQTAGHDMSNMSGHDMSNLPGHDMSNMGPMASAPGAANQPYDLQFIDGMIHHHEGSVKMSNMVLGKTERPQLKGFAQRILDDQTKEIDQMKQWREQWFAGKPSALNMEMPGMTGGTAMMNSEHMKEMDSMDPEHFDQHFLKMMIAHHEGAVTMSREALKKTEHPEIKRLAETIIKTQEGEIKQMQKWQSEWPK